MGDASFISGRRWLKPALLIVLALAATGFFLRNVILGKPVETYEAVRSDPSSRWSRAGASRHRSACRSAP
jgi:hypothetical protein